MSFYKTKLLNRMMIDNARISLFCLLSFSMVPKLSAQYHPFLKNTAWLFSCDNFPLNWNDSYTMTVDKNPAFKLYPNPNNGNMTTYNLNIKGNSLVRNVLFFAKCS